MLKKTPDIPKKSKLGERLVLSGVEGVALSHVEGEPNPTPPPMLGFDSAHPAMQRLGQFED